MTTSDDPYVAPGEEHPKNSRAVSVFRVLAFGIVVASVVPFAMTVRELMAHYIGLSARPSASYRPVVIIIPMYWTFVVGVVAVPLFLIINKFGTDEDAAIAVCGSLLPMLAFGLSMIGPFLICWLTGSSFGS